MANESKVLPIAPVTPCLGVPSSSSTGFFQNAPKLGTQRYEDAALQRECNACEIYFAYNMTQYSILAKGDPSHNKQQSVYFWCRCPSEQGA